MTLNYFNYAHFLTILAAAGFIAIFYFTLKNRSSSAKEMAVYILMGINLTQHFYKSFFWPHVWGSGFGIINTAYNVCAILIISSPLIFVSRSPVLKQYIAYVGTIGPAVSMLVPYWFIGSTMLQWEYLRFWTCHTLLLATSLLPALWGMVKFNFRDGWKFGFVFLAMLSLILLNDTVFLLILGAATKKTLYDTLLAYNPLWTMAPQGGIEQFKAVFEALSLPFLLETESHPYIPILWYAIPMYLLITLAGYILGAITDRKRVFGQSRHMIEKPT